MQNGLLSQEAANRLKLCVELLADAAQTKRLWWPSEKRYVSFKLSFITLTLPCAQIHEDSYLSGVVLKEFLRWWRDSNPGLLYVWKAEVQDNGNLHFHLTTNSFIHHEKLRRKWNKVLRRHGYITEGGNQNPPSTEVKAVRKVKDIAAYICAYVGKKDVYQRALKRYHKRFGKRLKALETSVFELPKNYFRRLKRKVKCALWNASDELKIGPCRLFADDVDITRELYTLEAVAGGRVELARCVIYQKEGCSADLIPELSKAYDEHIMALRAKSKKVLHFVE